jgi:predicted RNase H-like HicB family nuclease
MKTTKVKALDYYDSLPYNIVLEPGDDGDGAYWVARVVELPYCAIHGDTPEEALKEIKTVKREWLETSLEMGNEIPEPASRKYSGQIRLRLAPTLHKLLSERAGIEDISLNHYMNTLLAQSVGFPVRDKIRGKTAKYIDS